MKLAASILLQDGSMQNFKGLNEMINPIDDQSRREKPIQDIEEDDEDEEEEPIIVQLLESQFSRKLEISQQLEMGMNIDIDELAHEMKLEMWRKVAQEFENKINSNWEKRRKSFEKLYTKIVEAKLRIEIANFEKTQEKQQREVLAEQMQNPFFVALKGAKEEREKYLAMRKAEDDEKALPLPPPQEYDGDKTPQMLDMVQSDANAEEVGQDKFDLFKHTHVDIDDGKFVKMQQQ